jgi:hypothetical protein
MAYLRHPLVSPYRVIWAFFRARRQPADFIYYAYARHLWRQRTLFNYGVLALLLPFWPLIFVGAWCKFTLRAGPKVRRLTGKGIVRQTLEQLSLALIQSISPEKYYNFDLYDDARRARAGEHIIRFVFKGGVHSLIAQAQAAQGQDATKKTMNDKLAFDNRCHAHGVRSIGSICSVDRDGALTWADGVEPVLPERDLFIKPLKGKGGRGCERWDHVGQGRWRRYGAGDLASGGELIAHLQRQAKAGGKAMLVQKRAVNHPELQDLCGAALSSMRIMSIRAPDGGIEVLFAVFKISGPGGSVVDNFHAGGFVCKVDMETGELGAATDWGIKQPGRWLETHPATGAQIAGRVLPLWRETVEVVRRGHLAFADRVAVAWDVSITDDGPRIIEGNNQFGLDMVQRTHRVPAGNSRFCELYAWHISCAANVLWGEEIRPTPLPATSRRDVGVEASPRAGAR